MPQKRNSICEKMEFRKNTDGQRLAWAYCKFRVKQDDPVR